MKQPILTLKLTGPGADMVFRGLAELPFKDVAPLFAELQRQIAAQSAVKKKEK